MKRPWKELLLEYRRRLLSSPQPLHPREREGELLRFLSAPGLVAVTGVRRCGKSFLAKRAAQKLQTDVGTESILAVYFDDERLLDMAPGEFAHIWEAFLGLGAPEGRKYLFLDEPQVVPGWERWVNRLRETENVGIVVSGSNASLLSSDLSTFLTGRHRQLDLTPLSFREFLWFRSVSVPDVSGPLMPEQRAHLRNELDRFAELGGFPQAVLMGDVSIAQDIFRDIVQKDLVARFKIRKVAQYRALAHYLASNTGTVLSLARLRDLCGVKSESSVRNFLDQFRAAYLFPSVSRFSYKLRRQSLSPPKVYCVDHGMARSVSFRFSANRGAILENMVFSELMRRHEEIFYLRTAGGREVDFLVRDRGASTGLVQSCIDPTDPDTRCRERVALSAARDDFPLPPATLVSWDFEGEVSPGVEAIPAWRWLLSP